MLHGYLNRILLVIVISHYEGDIMGGTGYHVCQMIMTSVCTSLFHRHNKCLKASSTMLIITEKVIFLC